MANAERIQVHQSNPELRVVPENQLRFMGLRDMVITPLTELGLVALAATPAYLAHRLAGAGLFACVLIYGLGLVAGTIAAHRVILAFWPVKPGLYSGQSNSTARYIWNLLGFLRITNLSFYGLVPVPFRKLYYGLLGMKAGKGIIAIAGHVEDPWLVSIEESAMIGGDALILPHVVLANDVLALGKIEIKRQALIGARSVIMPGVSIGEGAMINAMSVVPMNTKIGPGEVWGGVPAVRLR